jgi:Flp pilus assembly protein TadD
MGQLYTQDKKIAEARAAFEKAYSAEPDNERTSQAFAEWLIQQDDLDNAQKVAAALRKKQPTSVNAILLDGIVAQMRSEDAQAQEAMVEVLKLDPNNSIATNLLALILADSKDPADLERALGYAQRNKALFANNTQINITLAWVLYQMGRLAEANQILGAGISNPNADGAYLIARIMEAQNQPEKSAALLQQVLAQTAGGVFLYRRDAQTMLDRLKASGVQVPADAITPEQDPATAPGQGAGGGTTGAAPGAPAGGAAPPATGGAPAPAAGGAPAPGTP